jgi:hypothetical protein
MTIVIDTNRAIKLLEKAVAEKGEDYIDPRSSGVGGCKYVVDGAPSCIVGHVVAYAKPDIVPLLSHWESTALAYDDYWDEDVDDYVTPDIPPFEAGHGEDTSFPDLAYALERPDLFHFTEGANVVLTRAQKRQDRGDTWGTALKLAKELAVHYPN